MLSTAPPWVCTKGWDFAAAYLDTGAPAPSADADVAARLIRTRRSIFPKAFDGSKRVPLRAIEEILAAANWAPTHGRTQPWRFCVCGPEAVRRVLDVRDSFMTASLTAKNDEGGLKRHARKMASKRKQLANCSAVIFIVVARVPNKGGRFMPEWEEIAAVSTAVQNLHLQVAARASEGVAGYWSSGGNGSWLDAPELREMLGAEDCRGGDAPGKDLVLGAFYLGFCDPATQAKSRSARDPIADKVKWIW